MRKIVFTYGLISAGVSAVLWTIISYFMSRNMGLENGMLIGYTAMTISFLFIYFGMAAYRDNVAGGAVSFGKALQVGLWITLIGCVCYVIAWTIIYNTMIPDFMDRYAEHILGKMRARGATPDELLAKTAEMNAMKENYNNPLFFFFMTFMEPLPVGIIVSLISAIIVSRKRKAAQTAIN